MNTIVNCRFISNAGHKTERKTTYYRLFTWAAISIVISGFLVGSTALGSTPGCPDCPDWINFQSWWDNYHSDPVKDNPSSTSSLKAVREAAEAQEKEKIDNMAYSAAELLVSSDDDLSGRIILDARAPEDYERGHLSGARNVYWKSIQYESTLNPNLALHALRKAGVNNYDSIVVCGSGEDSAYLFWTLDYLGHDKLSLLDGDVTSSGRTLVQNAPSPNESNYSTEIRTWLSVDELTLAKHQDNPSGVQIWDVRPNFIDYGKCHLERANHLSTSKLYTDLGQKKFKSAGELGQLFDRLDEDKNQIIYGTPGACSLYFALKLMGYNSAVLDGDWWENMDDTIKPIS